MIICMIITFIRHKYNPNQIHKTNNKTNTKNNIKQEITTIYTNKQQKPIIFITRKQKHNKHNNNMEINNMDNNHKITKTIQKIAQTQT